MSKKFYDCINSRIEKHWNLLIELLDKRSKLYENLKDVRIFTKEYYEITNQISSIDDLIENTHTRIDECYSLKTIY